MKLNLHVGEFVAFDESRRIHPAPAHQRYSVFELIDGNVLDKPLLRNRHDTNRLGGDIDRIKHHNSATPKV
jgi:hypothetical protein